VRLYKCARKLPEVFKFLNQTSDRMRVDVKLVQINARVANQLRSERLKLVTQKFEGGLAVRVFRAYLSLVHA
jgi:hypothetical protein